MTAVTEPVALPCVPLRNVKHSCGAKDKRITAEQALRHPWVVGDAAELEKRDLGANMDKLRLFNARRKFKSAISSVSCHHSWMLMLLPLLFSIFFRGCECPHFFRA